MVHEEEMEVLERQRREVGFVWFLFRFFVVFGFVFYLLLSDFLIFSFIISFLFWFLVFYYGFFFNFLFVVECYKGEVQIWRDWKMSRIGVHNIKFPKN